MAAFGEMELSVFASGLKTSWCRGGGEPTLSGSVCIETQRSSERAVRKETKTHKLGTVVKPTEIICGAVAPPKKV